MGMCKFAKDKTLHSLMEPIIPATLVTARIRPHIRGKHRLIVVGYLSGMNNTEIAEAFGCAPATVGDVLRRPEVTEELSRLCEKRTDQVIDETLRLKQRLREVAWESLEAQIELSKTAEDERVKTVNLENILKRAGTVMGIDGVQQIQEPPVLRVQILPPPKEDVLK